jgi:isoquinoline 1-oxidoreductase beta subunit
VRAQVESAVVYGLSAVLTGEITIEKGRVKQGNFDDYPVLRMREMPEVEVHMLLGDWETAKLGGMGEPGLPPLAPAVANALFRVTGRRIRRLPLKGSGA